MIFFNIAWAYRFKYLPPVEKFILVTLAAVIGDRGETGLPLLAVSELPRVAESCNLPLDKFESTLEQVIRRGLVRVAPGPSVELCTFVDPTEWNQKKEKAEEVVSNGRKK